jgi:predicted nucleic acid-binding protein
VKQQAPHLAVDTNILFALADGQEAVATMAKLAQLGKALLFVPPECLAELSHAFSKRDRGAGEAIRSIGRTPGLAPMVLNSTQQAIAGSLARRLLGDELIPSAEKRDAMALAQAVAGGMSAFVTFDDHFLSMDRRKFSALLLSEHLPTIGVLSPIDFIKAARRAGS